jgi:hypothetical protein
LIEINHFELYLFLFLVLMVGSLACFTEGFYSDFEVSCVSKRAAGLTDGMVLLTFSLSSGIEMICVTKLQQL